MKSKRSIEKMIKEVDTRANKSRKLINQYKLLYKKLNTPLGLLDSRRHRYKKLIEQLEGHSNWIEGFRSGLITVLIDAEIL